MWKQYESRSLNAECGTLQVRNGETADCTDGQGRRDRQAERDANRDGQFKFLTVRNLISIWAGGGCGNGEVRNRVLSGGQLKKAEGRMQNAGAAHGHCGRYQRPTGDWERLEMMNKVKPLRNDRRLSQVEQHRSYLSPLKPNLSQQGYPIDSTYPKL